MMTDPKPADVPDTNITEQPAVPVPPAPSGEAAPAAPPAPVVEATPPTWPLKADYALLALLLVLSFLLASFTATNSENWLQLAIGRLISQGEFTIGADRFSLATEGVYWVHHSWLYSLLLYQFYNLAGGAGLVIGKAILFTGMIALLCRIGWTDTNRWFVLICVLIAALAVSTRLVLEPRVASYLLLAITLFNLNRAGVFAQPPAAAPDALPEAEAGPATAAPCADARCLWCLPPLFALWANLDAWFILGPIVVGLCWAATGLTKWFSSTGLVPGKALGTIFAAGMLACIVNPHHVRVFQLPPELAYIVLSLSDPLGVPLPNELIAAGRTMKELQKAEINIPWTASALSSKYWQDPSAGLNVAGLAVFPLLLMGLLAFGLSAFVKPQQNAPTLQVSRFLVWLFFVIVGLALYRLIPFFALAAAPLTAMTLGEFLDWQLTTNAVPVAQRGRGLRLARILSVGFCLVLIGLAWPGWVHSPFHNLGDFYAPAPRRVSWDMKPEPSMQRAAEALHAIDDGKKRHRVFNGNVELGNYLPWFAPGVQHYLDTRFPLFVGHAARYVAVKKALPDKVDGGQAWQGFFLEYGIDQVAMDGLVAAPAPRIFKWWSDPDQWRQRYSDTRVFVFSWAGPKESWPINSVLDDANQEAFGEVAATKRPPLRGVPPLQVPTVWKLYQDGLGRQPAGITEIAARQAHFGMHNQYQPIYGLMTFKPQDKPFTPPSCSLLAFSASLANLQGLPGGGATAAPALAILLNNWTLFRPRDFGPPALPVLMVRTARVAVAENPLNAESQVALTTATEVLRNLQEDYWINHQRGAQHPSSLREYLRQTQLAVGRFRAAALQPDSYEHQIKLVELYLQLNMPDLALERANAAEQAAEARMTAGKDLVMPTGEVVRAKDKDNFLRGFRKDMLKPLTDTVKERLARFEETKGPPLEKAIKAVRAEYHDLRQGDKIQQTRLGLARKALELLDAIEPASLKDQEHETFLRMTLDLHLTTGQVDRVADDLKKAHGLKRHQPDVYYTYQLVVAGVLGDYKAMDDALEMLEDGLRERLKQVSAETDRRRNNTVPMVAAAGTQTSFPALASTVGLRTAPAILHFSQAYFEQQQTKNDLGNVMALRGITALESGDTKQARSFFQTALAEDEKTFPYADRPIAQRYLELLDQQVRKR